MTSAFNSGIFKTLVEANQWSCDLINSFIGSFDFNRNKSNTLQELKEQTFHTKLYINIQNILPSIKLNIPEIYCEIGYNNIALWIQRALYRINVATFIRFLELDNIYNAGKFSLHHICYEQETRSNDVQTAFVDLRTRLLATLVTDEIETSLTDNTSIEMTPLMERTLPLDGSAFGLYPEEDDDFILELLKRRHEEITMLPDSDALDALVTADDLINVWKIAIIASMYRMSALELPPGFPPNQSNENDYIKQEDNPIDVYADAQEYQYLQDHNNCAFDLFSATHEDDYVADVNNMYRTTPSWNLGDTTEYDMVDEIGGDDDSDSQSEIPTKADDTTIGSSSPSQSHVASASAHGTDNQLESPSVNTPLDTENRNEDEGVDDLVDEYEDADDLVDEYEDADDLVDEYEDVDDLVDEYEDVDDLVDEYDDADNRLDEALKIEKDGGGDGDHKSAESDNDNHVGLPGVALRTGDWANNSDRHHTLVSENTNGDISNNQLDTHSTNRHSTTATLDSNESDTHILKTTIEEVDELEQDDSQSDMYIADVNKTTIPAVSQQTKIGHTTASGNDISPVDTTGAARKRKVELEGEGSSSVAKEIQTSDSALASSQQPDVPDGQQYASIRGSTSPTVKKRRVLPFPKTSQPPTTLKTSDLPDSHSPPRATTAQPMARQFARRSGPPPVNKVSQQSTSGNTTSIQRMGRNSPETINNSANNNPNTTEKKPLKRQWHERRDGQPAPTIITWDDDDDEEHENDIDENTNVHSSVENNSNNPTRKKRRTMPAVPESSHGEFPAIRYQPPLTYRQRQQQLRQQQQEQQTHDAERREQIRKLEEQVRQQQNSLRQREEELRRTVKIESPSGNASHLRYQTQQGTRQPIKAEPLSSHPPESSSSSSPSRSSSRSTGPSLSSSRSTPRPNVAPLVKNKAYTKWSSDEVDALDEGLQYYRGRQWRNILTKYAHRFAPGRTNIDLRDKARNEIKSRKIRGQDLGGFQYAL
ncbi:unnamed protein product [Absidia cylindrospora]